MPTVPDTAPQACGDGMVVRVARGSIHLARETVDAWLPDVESVALLRRDAAVLIVPLQRDAGGGLLLKMRNARGDRVIHAQEFLRENGYPDAAPPVTLRARWDPQSAALVVALFAPVAAQP